MEQEQERHTDVAREPVDRNDDAEFMDTGVLHELRPCAKCGTKKAARGSNVCPDCKE